MGRASGRLLAAPSGQDVRTFPGFRLQVEVNAVHAIRATTGPFPVAARCEGRCGVAFDPNTQIIFAVAERHVIAGDRAIEVVRVRITARNKSA